MITKTIFNLIALLVISTSQTVVAQPASTDEKVSFNRDVRPILASKCYACHGPDEDHQEAGLRFDQREVAVDLKAIVPGAPDQSEMISRIFSADEDAIMPPPHSGESLTPAQKRILKKWIVEGAKYQTHWAFEKPKATSLPKVTLKEWPRNGIDNFVLHKLESQNIQPNQPADRLTLVRRVYLDLIGLPPTAQQADTFVNSNDPNAYEKLVDELLQSDHYGERWATPWLDLARYSDTNGYEKDRERSIWPYRDWVIRSLNADMPYDQFSIEQLAGDMLTDPTPDQRIATGFHRNTMLNEEGGIDPLEFRFLAMVDRVATTGTVWLGLTTGCAQCHTHKYDPISHTDYYRLMALMNNADEPDFQIPNDERRAQIVAAKKGIQKLERDLEKSFPPTEGESNEADRRKQNLNAELAKWIEATKKNRVSKWNIIRPTKMKTTSPKLQVLPDGSIFATGDVTKRDIYNLTFNVEPNGEPIHSIRIEAIPDSRLPDGGPGKTYYEGRKGDFFLSEIEATKDGTKIEFASATHSYADKNVKAKKVRADNVYDGDGSSGWNPGKNKSTRLQLVLNLKNPIESSGKLEIEMLFERHYTVSLGRFRISTSANKHAVAHLLEEEVEILLAGKSSKNWSAEEAKKIRRAFLLDTPLLAQARKKLDRANSSMPKLNHTLVLSERPSDNVRPTHLHVRGEWLRPDKRVTPGIPEVLVDSEASSPRNRLELARWLVSDSNPLASRVAVNRAWREIFGAGLMRTSGDFGVQSSPPTHPELLDWLAVEFKDNLGWSNKRLHRLIVTSATYRQSSVRAANQMASDPDNRLLARGPSFRVSGEMVRDIALQATGSLSTKMFGRGVRPPQPEIVTKLAYGAQPWKPSEGEDRFRRSIYTFKKRTAAFAAYTVFDGPTGESCTAKRNRSNTPLQALTVLNDQMYQEFSKNLANTAFEKFFGSKQKSGDAGEEKDNNADREKQDTQDAALTWIFRSFLTRKPTGEELASLKSYYQTQLERLKANKLDAKSIGGESATPNQAALAMVARVVMNLDETITKR